MNIKQHHGIKVGDLVKFKHHIFDGFTPVHLVVKVLNREGDTRIIKLHGGDDIHHRANNFIVIAKAKR